MEREPSGGFDAAAELSAIRARTRRRRRLHALRTGPAIATWFVVWIAISALGMSWLLAAFPAGLAGAAVYRALEKKFPDLDD